jgi:hypothetical protein
MDSQSIINERLKIILDDNHKKGGLLARLS